jgi:hypothetical protein
MYDPSYEAAIVCVGLALLFVFCLPIAGLQKLVLETSAWALRLALLAALGAAAYFWFRPADLPTQVTDVLNDFPRVRALLPEPTAPGFAAYLVAPIVAALLPLLAVLDVSRRLAGRRLCRLRTLSKDPVTVAVVTPAASPVLRRIDRREAADAMTTAARKPDRPAERRTR